MPVRTRKRLNGFRILRDPTPRKLTRNDFRASIDGYELGLSATEAALVSSLHRQLGQVIRYARFSRIIHSDCTRWKGLHLLRQYMFTIRKSFGDQARLTLSPIPANWAMRCARSHRRGPRDKKNSN
jgi:hypothetical protein